MAPLLHHLVAGLTSASFVSVSRHQPRGGVVETTTTTNTLSPPSLSSLRRIKLLAQSNNKNPSSLLDEDQNCIFGKKEYWDSMYEGKAVDDRPSNQYSWYCGWDELRPFWNELVPLDANQKHILIAGMGNDITPINIYDEGYTTMTAFDYSQAGVDRATELFGKNRLNNVNLYTADACDLKMIETGSIDVTLDKGTLDAIYITGTTKFQNAVRELTRVTSGGGIVMCISRVIYEKELLEAFDDSGYWENIHDGSLAFAPDGEATIDLGAELYSWRRTNKVWSG